MWGPSYLILLALVLSVLPAHANQAVRQPVSAPTEGSLHGFLAPEKSTRYAAIDPESKRRSLTQDGIYARPFIGSISTARSKTAIGGYMEANGNYFVEDGITDGFSMEFRRFNLFVYSSIAQKIKFFSELEFEHGTKEISLETAQLDFVLDPALALRAGIILPPIGRFNVNHDSPLYEFVERPLVSENLIPGTLSEVGGGLYGKVFSDDFSLTYDFYIVNGLQEGIVLNSDSRTFVPGGKSEEAFGEDNNGRPSYTGRLGFAHEKVGELGISYYGGIYNTFRLDGEDIAPKRYVHLTALDFDTNIFDLTIQGEVAFADIDVAPQLRDLFGEQQYGLYVDFVYPVFTFDWIANITSVLNLAARIDRIDFNMGEFNNAPAVGDKIFDEQTALSLGISLRPVPDTVIRLVYRKAWVRDFLGNPAPANAGFRLGIASYF